MAEVVARDEKFVREYEPREEAFERVERDGDFMKTHFVTKFTEPGSEVSFYRNGSFVDFAGVRMCLPQPREGRKLTTLAGAYWLGDEKNPQLQRIHGTRSSRRKIWMRILRGLRNAAKRAIACWASNWTSSAFRNWLARDSSSGIQKRHVRKIMETGCATSASSASIPALCYTPHVQKMSPRASQFLNAEEVQCLPSTRWSRLAASSSRAKMRIQSSARERRAVDALQLRVSFRRPASRRRRVSSVLRPSRGLWKAHAAPGKKSTKLPLR